jgi:hypothetical protein
MGRVVQNVQEMWLLITGGDFSAYQLFDGSVWTVVVVVVRGVHETFLQVVESIASSDTLQLGKVMMPLSRLSALNALRSLRATLRHPTETCRGS